MSRLDNIISELYSFGISLKSKDLLTGGINSSVYLIETPNGSNYALKIYPIEHYNRRLSAELNFLKFLVQCDISCVPRVVCYSESNSWILLSWICGNKLDHLTNADITQISHFISSINSPTAQSFHNQLHPASDSYSSLAHCVSSIETRLDKMLMHKPSTELEVAIFNWLSDYFTPLFCHHKELLLQRKKDLSHWSYFSPFQIASPSDVGIHNVLETPYGLSFIDFEYSGLDDMSKFVGDWILQPNYCFTDNQESFFINQIMDNMPFLGSSWIDRFFDLRYLMICKWILIMLKGYNTGTCDEIHFNNTLAYCDKKLISSDYPS